MLAHLVEGDLDLPARDKPLHDLHGLNIESKNLFEDGAVLSVTAILKTSLVVAN